jgi:hypothetical protein
MNLEIMVAVSETGNRVVAVIDGEVVETFLLDGELLVPLENYNDFIMPVRSGDTWVEGGIFDLVAYKMNKIESLYNLCNQAILGIFSSSAMGTPHDYIFDFEAQMNLAGTKQAFNDNLITNIEWNTRDVGPCFHDATQFNQLWLDGFTHKVSNMTKYRTLKGQVEIAVDKAGVDSIEW